MSGFVAGGCFGTDPTDLIRSNEALLSRLSSAVLFPETGCLLRKEDKSDYGAISIGKTSNGEPIKRPTHRVAYELAYGPIPDGHHVDHICFTPACVQPLHLEAVSHWENFKRGRANVNGWFMSHRRDDELRIAAKLHASIPGSKVLGPKAWLRMQALTVGKRRFVQWTFSRSARFRLPTPELTEKILDRWAVESFGLAEDSFMGDMKRSRASVAAAPFIGEGFEQSLRVEGVKPLRVRPERLRTQCKRGHEYTESNTRWAADGTRSCNRCIQANQEAQRVAWLAQANPKQLRHSRLYLKTRARTKLVASAIAFAEANLDARRLAAQQESV